MFEDGHEIIDAALTEKDVLSVVLSSEYTKFCLEITSNAIRRMKASLLEAAEEEIAGRVVPYTFAELKKKLFHNLPKLRDWGIQQKSR